MVRRNFIKAALTAVVGWLPFVRHPSAFPWPDHIALLPPAGIKIVSLSVVMTTRSIVVRADAEHAPSVSGADVQAWLDATVSRSFPGLRLQGGRHERREEDRALSCWYEFAER